MKNAIFVLIFFTFYVGFSQKTDELSSQKNKLDTIYINDISDKLIIKINEDNNFNSSKYINKQNNQSYELNYSQGYKSFISLDYKFIELTLGISQKYVSFVNGQSKKRETKSINLGFPILMNKWLQNINYNYIQGFYIDDSYPNNTFSEFKNLSKAKYSGTTSYIFNNTKFSYFAYAYQTAIQKKSAGSFIPSLNYYYMVSKDAETNPIAFYKDHLIFTNFALGYQYNWVPHKNLLISAGASTGFGFNYSERIDSLESEKVTFFSSNFALNSNLTLSYQINRIFFGSQLYYNFVKSKDDKTTSLSNNNNYGVFFVGYRFNTPKIIEKPFNWIENL